MEIGAVFPQTEIGNDPVVIRDFAQAVEELGFTHLLVYDHVLGADPDRPGGWQGPYDKDTAFHEPFVLFGYLAAVTRSIDLVTPRSTSCRAAGCGWASGRGGTRSSTRPSTSISPTAGSAKRSRSR